MGQSAAGPLALFLLLLIQAASAIEAGPDPLGPAGTEPPSTDIDIVGLEVCDDDEMVVAGNLTVRAGGELRLQGCMLRMDAPPYEDREFAEEREGVLVRVEPGGKLTMLAEPGHPSGIGRADSRYGYQVKSHGEIRSIGLPGTPNVVEGLEGAFQGKLAMGGLQAGGTNVVEHTVFRNNTGMGFGLAPGGTLAGHNLTFTGQGTLASIRGGAMELQDLVVEGTYVALFATKAGPIRVDRCALSAVAWGVQVVESDLSLVDCRVQADSVALDGQGGTTRLTRTTIGHPAIGVGLRPGLAGGPATLVGDQVAFKPGPAASVGLTGTAVDATLTGCTFGPALSGAINLTSSKLRLEDCRLDREGTGIAMTNPVGLEVKATSGPSPLVKLGRDLALTVTDQAGLPVAGVAVHANDVSATTDAKGTARLSWPWTAGDLAGLPEPAPVIVQVDAATGTVRETLPADAAAAVVQLQPTDGATWRDWVLPGAIVLGGLAGLASYLLWNRSRSGS